MNRRRPRGTRSDSHPGSADPNLPPKGRDAQEVQRDLDAALSRDATFESGRILGSMCTQPHPVALEAYTRFLATNLGDPALFPGTAELEARAQEHLARLLHAGPDSRVLFTTGGTEANFTGLRIARERTGKQEVVLPETAHFSFDKACSILELTPRRARVQPDYTVDVDHVRELVGSDTGCIVGVAGNTEFGAVDPVPELAEVALTHDVPLHVDAAYGGFVLPFLDPNPHPPFDLGVEGVTTVTVDPHKMGMAPIPAGALAVQDEADVERISTESPYVSTDKQATLQGTRPGAAPAAAWTAMQVLGEAGYRSTVTRCLRDARFLADEVQARGAAVALDPPPLGVVAIPMPDPQAAAEALAREGWHVNLAPMSGGIKVVVMPHVHREHLRGFLEAWTPIHEAQAEEATREAPARG